VRTQDRKQRIRERQSAGFALDEDDRQWIAKTEQPSWRQLFLPDLRRSTVMATFVATMALVSYSTVGMWMPLLYLVGAVRDDRLLGRRLDDRPARPARRLWRIADRGRGLHDDLDLCP
jgi:hypothetical protein